ncbi:MAG: hypothetical protein AB7O24_22445 [Kofleriaceae bacterium]
MRRLSIACLFGLLALLATCVVQSNPPPGPRPPPSSYGPPPPPQQPPAQSEPTITPIVDERGTTYQIAQGVPGSPDVVGCADGQREAFVDVAQFPTIAGCIAEWTGNTTLRMPPTQLPCGDDRGGCGSPADACAPGWRLCGSTGAIADLLRVSPEQCEQAGGGRFVAAISHCKTQSGCKYEPAQTGSYQCFEKGWCSEPVCCGNDCGQFGVCRDGVWPGKTHIPVGTDQGCGSIGSSRARGVMCCKA